MGDDQEGVTIRHHYDLSGDTISLIVVIIGCDNINVDWLLAILSRTEAEANYAVMRLHVGWYPNQHMWFTPGDEIALEMIL